MDGHKGRRPLSADFALGTLFLALALLGPVRLPLGRPNDGAALASISLSNSDRATLLESAFRSTTAPLADALGKLCLKSGFYVAEGSGYKASIAEVLGGDAPPLTYQRGDHHLAFTPEALAWVGPYDRRITLKEGVRKVSGKLTGDASELEGSHDASWAGRGVLYKDAFGPGLHLGALVKDHVFRKIVRFDSRESLGAIPDGVDDLEVRFEIHTEKDTYIKARFGGNRRRDWDRKQTLLSRNEPVAFGRRASPSFLQPARAWDSAGNETAIFLEFKAEQDRLLLSKRIPITWLQQAIFPVYADVDLSLAPPVVFNAASTSSVSVTAIDSTHVVIAYNNGNAVVGTVSGDSINFGTPASFHSGSTLEISATTLDSTHVLIAYAGSSSYGTAVVGTVSGSSIAFGSPYVFNSSSTLYLAATALDSSRAVFAYLPASTSTGYGVVATVSGSSISFGTPTLFDSTLTYSLSATTLSTTTVVISYDDAANSLGGAVVGTVSGNSISFGSPQVFNAGSTVWPSSAALDSSRVVFAYRDHGASDYGTAIVGTVSGNNLSFGSEFVFAFGWSDTFRVAALDSSHVVIAYEKYGCSPKPCPLTDYGMAIVGTVSGTTITYGSPDVFGGANTSAMLWSDSITALDSTHVAIAYRDTGNSDFATAVVGHTVPSVPVLIGFETGDGWEIASPSGAASFQTGTVRPGSGTYSLREGATSTLVQGLSPALDKIGVRFSFLKPINPPVVDQTLLQFRNGAANLWALELRTDGKLQLRGDEAINLVGPLAGTTALPNNVWFTVRVVYDNTAGGVARVWVANRLEIDVTHVNAGTATDTILVSGLGSPNEFFYDDFYVHDSISVPPPGQIVRKGPDGEGLTEFNSVGGTPGPASSTHYLNVDELSPNDDGDWNGHDLNSVATDMYTMENAPAAAINAVKAVWRMKRGSGSSGDGSHNYVWNESGRNLSLQFELLGAAWSTQQWVRSAPPESGGSWTTAKVDSLELGAQHNGTQGQDTYVSWVVAMVDYDDGTTAVTLTSFAATGLDGEVLLEWQTATELNNLGFHLYRADSRDGPYERITASAIPGLGSSPVGARYRYMDTGLTNGATYYYKLEDVETTGKTEFHGPVSAMPEAGAPSDGGDSGEGSSGVVSSCGGDGARSRIIYGDPSASILRVVERGRSSVVLELLTEGFCAEPQEDGSVRLEIPGFEALIEANAPGIPVKRAWVEVLAGRKVELASVRARGVERFENLLPSDAELGELVASWDGTVRVGRRPRNVGQGSLSALRREGLYPSEAARIVSVGFQGDVKKALVELSPVRWDGTTGQLLLARRLEVRLSFRDRDPAEQSTDGARGRRYLRRSSHEERVLVARFATTDRGLYGVSFEEIFGQRGRDVSASWLRLSRQGEAVAFHLEPNLDRFQPGSVLYFLSEGASANAYGNQAVYELELGRSGQTMPVGDAPPSGESVGFYWERLAKEDNRLYQAGLVDAPDRWLWDLVFAPAVKTYSFEITALAPVAEDSHLEVWLQGASDFPANPDHHVRVSVNGSLVEESSWDGKGAQPLGAEMPSGLLQEGENTLAIENVGDTEASYSMVMLDRFRVSYPRSPIAVAGRLEGRWTASGVAEIVELGAGTTVLDVTEKPPIWLRGIQPGSGGSIRFHAEAGRSYLAVRAGAVLAPQVSRATASGLKSPRNRADYVVIGPLEFLKVATPVLELRRSQGLRAKAVSTEEIYSEFGFGESNPQAIREFLSYAYHRWATPSLRYVLILGDGTFDYKDYLGTGVANEVPPLMVKTTYLWTASDPAYAAVNGEDVLPDVAIGRLPAATVEEARAMVEKIVAYETGTARSQAPAVLVADDPDQAGDFEADAEELASSVLAERNPQKIYLSRLGTAATRNAIVEAFNHGMSLMSYVGHGGIHLWADENIFNIWDVDSMAPQPEQPMVLTMNCLNGYFHFPYFESLSEALVEAPEKGAIAAFSPSGFSLNSAARLYHEALLREILHGGHERLGDAVLAAQVAYAGTGASPELLSIYHLLGDPALRLR